MEMDGTSEYIELLKKCLCASLYPQNSYEETVAKPGKRPIDYARRMVVHTLASKGYRLYKTIPFDPERRNRGGGWPSLGYTMIGMKRLTNLQMCVEAVLRDNVPGDLIETGVWKGGACILMRAILKLNGSSKNVWVADSFEGLPVATTEPDKALNAKHQNFDLAGHPILMVSLTDVQAAFERFGLLDSHVKFLKGWFKDTLPVAPIDKLAILRLDGDMYESTMDALKNLYRKLSPGGFCIVDDYGGWETCKQAVDEFRKANGITEPLNDVDGQAVYWRYV